MSGRIENYEDLMAWQKAMDLVEALYRATQAWPREELYGLTNQARRSVVCVPANIAEGKGRYGSSEFLHYLSMAKGSLHETETHIHIARRLGYLKPDEAGHLLMQSAEVGQLISGLMRSLRTPNADPRTPRLAEAALDEEASRWLGLRAEALERQDDAGLALGAGRG